MINQPEPRRVILVADDEPLVRLVASRTLRNGGFDIVEAGGGSEALAIVARQPLIALVLADVQMPLGDGLTLARTLRQRRPALPVLLMSAYPADAWVGLAPFITKPFGLGALVDTIRTMLDLRTDPPACDA